MVVTDPTYVHKIDRNVQTLRRVEEMSTMPTLPDMVKLDLAAFSGLTPAGLNEFMHGVSADVHEATSQPRRIAPTLELSPANTQLTSGPLPPTEEEDPPIYEFPGQRQFIRGMSGLSAPRDVEGADSVLAFKQRAVRLGYLHPDDVTMDHRWDPAYNQLAWEMSMDDFNRRIQGEGPGPGSSISDIGKFFDDWLSLTGLLHAGMQLGFLWNPEQIKREITEYDPAEFLSEWLENPFDVRKLWKFTGPLDDLVLPIINIGLMATGIGEVMAATRAMSLANKAFTGVRGLRAYQLANGTGRWAAPAGGRFTAAGPVAGPITRHMPRTGRLLGEAPDAFKAAERLTTPGWLGGKVGGTTGDLMASWRNLRGVVVGKTAAKHGMRIGLASRVEERLLGFEGIGLEQLAPGAVEFSAEMRRNPFAWVLGEALFTPYNVFEKGQIANPFGFVKKFAAVGEHGVYADEFAEAVAMHIERGAVRVGEEGLDVTARLTRRQQELEDWQATVKRLGPTKALAERFTGGDTEKLGAWLTWQITLASIESSSAQFAKMAHGGAKPGTEVFTENAVKYDELFRTHRNKLISEIRYVDPDDPVEFLWTMAWSRGSTKYEVRTFFDEYMRAYKELEGTVGVNIQSLIKAHNARRQDVWARLLGDHMEPGLIRHVMANALEQTGDWDGFVAGMDGVKAAYISGGLDHAVYAAAVSPETGVRVGGKRGRIRREKSFTDMSEDRHWSLQFDDILQDQEFRAFEARTGGIFDPVARTFAKGGKFTVARPATPTYQSKASHLSVIKFLYSARGAIKSLRGPTTRKLFEEIVARADKVPGSHVGFADIRQGQLEQIIADMEAANAAKVRAKLGAGPDDDVLIPALLNQEQVRHVKRVHRYVKKHKIEPGSPYSKEAEEMLSGVDGAHRTAYLDDMDAHLTSRLHEISRDEVWALDYGIDSTLSLDQKVKALEKQMPHTAVEVDPESIPEALRNVLEENGYKLVHGTEFAAPGDLLDLTVEIQDMVNKTRYTDRFGTTMGGLMASGHDHTLRGIRGLGRSLTRHEPEYANTLYRAATRNALFKALAGHETPADVLTRGRHFSSYDSADLDTLMDVLHKVTRLLGEEGVDLVRAKREMSRMSAYRVVTNIRSSFTPAQPTDLVRSPFLWKKAVKRIHAVTDDMGFKYSDEELVRIYDGLKGSRVIGRDVRGAITNGKDKLQATPLLSDGLRLLGRTAVAQKPGMSAPVRGLTKGAALTTRVGATATGGYLGGALYAAHNDRGADGAVDVPIISRFTGPLSLGEFSAGFFSAVLGRAAGGKIVNRAFAGTGITKGAARSGLKLFRGDDPKYFARLRRSIQRLSSPSVTARQIDKSVAHKHWAYIGDGIATLRDFLRFTVSPIFDMSRYSEAIVLGQMGDIPKHISKSGGIRFNVSPGKWIKSRSRELAGGRGKRITDAHREQAYKEWDEVVDEFSTIGRHRNDFDYAALEAGTARFRQIGILGFNTQEWMASLYADLTRIHGIPRKDAYEIARKAFTYGVKPRSAAEMNVNAVFFPFSFMKKASSHAAKFMFEDWSRAAMLHDSLKTYEILNEEYDLSQMWRDRLPILEKLRRLNIFAYGVTPGEFGGAERPLIDFWNTTPMAAGTTDQMQNLGLMIGKELPVLQAFIPHGLNVKSEQDMFNYERLMRRIAPMINDIDAMLDDLAAQGHVIFGGHGVTKEAEARIGSALLNQFKLELDSKMKVIDGDPDGISNLYKKRHAARLLELQTFKDELAGEYAGWKEAREDIVSNVQVRDEDRRYHKRMFERWRKDNPDALVPTEPELRIGYLVDWAETLERRYGDYDAVPLDQLRTFLDLAGEWAEDDYFRIKYRQFLRSTWGTIETVKDD